MSSEVAISDIADIVMGQSPKKKDVNEDGNGYPLLNGPTEFAERYPEPVQFTTDGKRYSKAGDILFCVRGSTTGRMNYADQSYAIGRGIAAIRGKDGYPTPFIRAVIEKNLDRLLIAATGSTFPNVSKSLLNDFEVEVISPNAAQKVNEIIVSIEDKIHLNQQTNETLEAMAQAIFKSWFVDFDPVRAKIEARSAGRDPNRAAMAAIAGVSFEMGWDEIETTLQRKLDRMSDEQRTQLRQTAELFPDELVESEIGEVPKGWGISEIGKEVNSVGGTTPRTKNPEYWEGGKIAWTTPKDLSNANSKILLETDRKITDEGLGQISSGLLPIDTVLMSSRAPVGYLALSKIPVAINQGYIAMICDKVLTPEYVLQWTESNMDMIKQHAGGSTFSEISKRNFRPLPVLVPSKEILNSYSEKAGSLYDMITANIKENRTLENLRDTLLPKLISGEIKLN